MALRLGYIIIRLKNHYPRYIHKTLEINFRAGWLYAQAILFSQMALHKTAYEDYM